MTGTSQMQDLSAGVAPATTRVMNLSQFLTQAARRHPGGIGFVWGEQHWTWAEMEARAEAMAHALMADALPDRFGNALIDAWMAQRGIAAVAEKGVGDEIAIADDHHTLLQMQRSSLFPVRPVFRLEHRRHGISARNINFRE